MEYIQTPTFPAGVKYFSIQAEGDPLKNKAIVCGKASIDEANITGITPAIDTLIGI